MQKKEKNIKKMTIILFILIFVIGITMFILTISTSVSLNAIMNYSIKEAGESDTSVYDARMGIDDTEFTDEFFATEGSNE